MIFVICSVFTYVRSIIGFIFRTLCSLSLSLSLSPSRSLYFKLAKLRTSTRGRSIEDLSARYRIRDSMEICTVNRNTRNEKSTGYTILVRCESKYGSRFAHFSRYLLELASPSSLETRIFYVERSEN